MVVLIPASPKLAVWLDEWDELWQFLGLNGHFLTVEKPYMLRFQYFCIL